METTILTDGRQVQADECRDIDFALSGDDGPVLEGHRHLRESATIFGPMYSSWYIECQCCKGRREHHWSPSGHGVDPDGGEYGCEPCASKGSFKVETP